MNCSVGRPRSCGKGGEWSSKWEKENSRRESDGWTTEYGALLGGIANITEEPFGSLDSDTPRQYTPRQDVDPH